MQTRTGDMTGKQYRAKGRHLYGVPDLPNERAARNGKGRLTCGWHDLRPWEMDDLAREHFPRKLGGDWRTGRAPAMRPERTNTPGMSLTQGGYGPGSYGYELDQAQAAYDALFAGAEGASLPPWLKGSQFERPPRGVPLDAGLTGNPNRGATREKKFGLDLAWVQRVRMEKWSHRSVSGVQYFLICPGVEKADRPRGDVSPRHLSSVDRKGLKGLTGTTSNCGDGSKGAHGRGWVCGQRVYKLFWVLGRPSEHRDAVLAEQWIAGLTSGQLSRQSAEVSALIDRYGPIMGDDRQLRCRRCLRLRYGQSPEVLRRKRLRRSR